MIFFPSLFTAPVYENEQTAIESYDGGELDRLNKLFGEKVFTC